jgi:hypothetical protein
MVIYFSILALDRESTVVKLRIFFITPNDGVINIVISNTTVIYCSYFPSKKVITVVKYHCILFKYIMMVS